MNRRPNHHSRIAGLAIWLTLVAIVPPIAAAPNSLGEPEVPTPPAETATPSDMAATPREAPSDRIETSDTVPPSSVEVTTIDARSMPVAGIRIELVRDRQSIAEGNASTKWQATTDSMGRASFSQIPSGSDSQYRVVAIDGTARYGTRPFPIERRAGTKVAFHVYPVVNDFKQALVAGRGFLFVEPRDEVLAFEYMHQFHNLGQTVLAANAVEITLPNGWKAFSTNPTDSDLAIKKTDRGVQLIGSIAPGQHSIVFTFQIPNSNREHIEVDLNLWPNTAEAQVATLARPGLELAVEGFPNPELAEEPGRPPFMVTRRAFTHDAAAPAAVHIDVAGLPIVGPGRWVAVTAGAVLALGAMLLAFARRQTDRSNDSVAAARTRIVDELAAVELAHRQGKLGDATYADTREVLLSAFVRLARESSNN